MKRKPQRNSLRLTMPIVPALALILPCLIASSSTRAADKPASLVPNVVAFPPDRVSFETSDGQVLLQYQRQPIKDSKLPVDSAGYFHPFTSPSGIVMTDLAPADHRHHRGVFLAWVEMHGAADADFWGWGEHAPIKDRRIVNRKVSNVSLVQNLGTIDATNDWTADGKTIIEENLHATFRATPEANILDLTYTLTPTADLTLSRWAFSGFCVRTRKDGKLQAFGPDGQVDLPNPIHTKPESDWPAASWYGYTLQFDDGKVAGVAVIDHPKNPPSLWHNHRDVRMLNPCIVAPAAVSLKANTPLTLRYRVITHDGATPIALLKRLSQDW